jgi:hypothetical protein
MSTLLFIVDGLKNLSLEDNNLNYHSSLIVQVNWKLALQKLIVD